MSTKKDAVDASDPTEEEGEGLLGRLGKAWDDFAYKPAEGEPKEGSSPPPRPSAAPTATALPTPVTAVAGAAVPSPSVDAEIVRKTTEYMHSQLLQQGTVFTAFMSSYNTLRNALPDVKVRVNAAAALLVQNGKSAVDLKLGLTDLRGVLNVILQKAKDQRDNAKQGIEQKRDGISARFQQEETELNQRITNLTTELTAAQKKLTELPGRRQQELSTLEPELRTLEISHASVETAYQQVVNELGTIERNLE